MTTMLQIAELSAWIMTSGVIVQTYATELSSDGKSASGWIPLEMGVPFTVNWHNTWRGYTIQSVVTVDGVPCLPDVMLDANLAPSGGDTVITSHTLGLDFMTQDLVFLLTQDYTSLLPTTNTQHTFGTITLELWAMQATSAECYFLTPNSTPMFRNVNGFRLHNAPLRTFTFRYQPFDTLMANGIIPRATLGMGALNADAHQKATEIRQLEARLQVLRQVYVTPPSPPALPVYPPLTSTELDVSIPNVQSEDENVTWLW